LLDPRILGIPRNRSYQKLIEHHSKGVNIAARININAAGISLLRAHICGRAHGLPMESYQRHFCQRLSERLGDTEIDDLRYGLSIMGRDQNVGWLQIPMDDSFLVCMLDGFT
jgi:hypothetical protein